LINLSRGGVVNEEAVCKALKEGSLAGAAFDVFKNEPNFNESLVLLDNFFSTPHIAGTSRSASLKLGLSSIQGLVENKF
jgi:D-3-phosphoglycerate dehydrogenase